MIKKLILGCGHHKKCSFEIKDESTDITIVSLDINPNVNPDIVWDLEVRPLPFEDNSFDVIEACDVLEHIGIQGDVKSFFEEFGEYYRILKPDGRLCSICPALDSIWLWGDPGHKRTINDGTIVFLSKDTYELQLNAGNPISDYRYLLGNTNFSIELSEYTENKQFIFVLKAIK